MSEVAIRQTHRAFAGRQGYYAHRSEATGTEMGFSVFTPPGPGPFPLLIYYSGLTCSEENATVKAGFQRLAAEHGLIVACPDTSPRGEGVPDVEDDIGLGWGASFYVDATQAPWSTHFRMDSYASREFPALLIEHFPVDAERIGLTGHSMGGMAALKFAIREPARFRSVSAFAPVTAPCEAPRGRLAFTTYLGPDRARWAGHDPSLLIEEHGWPRDILIDQGSADPVLDGLLPGRFEEACNRAGVRLELRWQAEYDHSYFFVSTFMADHIAWHAERLKG